MRKVIIPKEIFKRLYFQERKTLEEIGDILKISYRTVWSRFHEFGFIALSTWKDRHFTEEQKKEMSIRKKGKPGHPHTLEHKKYMSRIMCGAKNWQWKGGVKSENAKIRKSFEYRIWRTSVFERDNWTCQICKVRGGKLEADHIKLFSLHPELRFVLDNGRTLCKPCHLKTPTWGSHKGQGITMTI